VEKRTKGALIGGVCVIVAAIVGPVVSHALNENAGTSPAPTPGASSAEAGSGSLPSTLSPESIRWSGSVTIPNASGDSGFLNLDQLPPSDTAGDLGWSVGASACAGGSCVWASGLDVSTWTGSGPPDYSQCREWAQTHGLGDAYIPAQAGTELCLITAAGHTALLQITGIDNSTNTASANVTIWTG
jgi:hypothetical protein